MEDIDCIVYRNVYVYPCFHNWFIRKLEILWENVTKFDFPIFQNLFWLTRLSSYIFHEYMNGMGHKTQCTHCQHWKLVPYGPFFIISKEVGILNFTGRKYDLTCPYFFDLIMSRNYTSGLHCNKCIFSKKMYWTRLSISNSALCSNPEKSF